MATLRPSDTFLAGNGSPLVRFADIPPTGVP